LCLQFTSKAGILVHNLDLARKQVGVAEDLSQNIEGAWRSVEGAPGSVKED